MTSLDITDVLKIGENGHGYEFCVGLVDERWVGFAIGHCDDGRRHITVFFDICEESKLGLTDRDEVIKQTGAFAQAAENGYGGITRWFVDEPLRGDPDQYRCEHCEEVLCDGSCEDAGGVSRGD